MQAVDGIDEEITCHDLLTCQEGVKPCPAQKKIRESDLAWGLMWQLITCKCDVEGQGLQFDLPHSYPSKYVLIPIVPTNAHDLSTHQ